MWLLGLLLAASQSRAIEPAAQPFTPAVAATAPDSPIEPLPDALAQAGTWREAPEYLNLFVPPAIHGAYRAYTSPQPVDAALRSIASIPSLLHPPGAWEAHASIPGDAFGQGIPANRWTLARLYGPNPVHVARGPRGRNGLADETWTLLSPYPALNLRQLEPGTLLLVAQVPTR